MQPEPRYYEFREKHQKSQQFQAYLERIIRSRWPNVQRIEQASERCDKDGTDYWVYLSSGNKYSIDLKVREQDYAKKPRPHGGDDLALETWSVIPKQGNPGKIGWTRDITKRTDYVVWYWIDTQRFFIVSFPILCRIFRKHWNQWREQYKTAPQNSGAWKSECTFVPRSLLEEKIRTWGHGRLKD